MLDKIKLNLPIIIITLILTFIGTKSIYEYIQDCKIWDKVEQNTYEKCHNNTQEFKEICLRYEQKVKKRDVISTFGYITQNYDIAYLQILAPLLIMTTSILIFNKLLRNGYLQNIVIRINYKKAIKRIYIKSLKCSIIIPIFLIIILLISTFLSDNFDYIYSVSHYMYDAFGIKNMKNIFIFIIFYLINFILHSIFWINIGIYNAKYNKNSIVCIIVSFIEYMLFLITLEQISLIFFSGTTLIGYLSLPIIWTYSEGVSIYGVTIVSLILILSSTLIIYLSYKNKEKVFEEISK